MTPNQVIKYYGSISAAARALQLTRQAVSYWKARGKIPKHVQSTIEIRTQGVLKAKES